MGEFDFDGLMSEDEIMNLLDNNLDTDEPGNDDEENNNDENNTAEGVEVDFDDPESVGSGEDNRDTGDTPPDQQKGGTSPDNIFSSIATLFEEEGIFPDLDEDTVKNIKTAEDFRNAIKAQLDAERTEQDNRIKKALDNGVEPDVIRQYEGLLNYLDSVESKLDEEGDEADEIRRRIIYQDCINKKFSKERAQKYVERAFADGTEKDEAKEALKSNKEFYSESYNNLLAEKQKEADAQVKEREERAKRIKKTITEDKFDFFGDIELSKQTRQAAYDAVSKPVFKDPETGEYLTAIQKLEHDNGEEFMAKLGLIYALTDGFSNIDKLVGKKVKKEVKKGFANLESVLQNTSRDSKGNLKFVSNDSESFASGKIKYPDFKTL